MRARKIESGLLVLVAMLAQSALVQSVAAADSSVAAHGAATELRTAQVQPTPRASAHMPHEESLQFAGLSPTADARAATLDAAPAGRSTTKDLLALILVGAMLVAYQLFRKHRLLRQQPFSL